MKRERHRIMPDGTRWMAALWFLLLGSLFFFSAYIPLSWGVVPGYVLLFAAIFLIQEAMLRAIIKHDREEKRIRRDEML